MPFLFALLVVGVLLLWTSMADLKRRLERRERQEADRDDRVTELIARIAALEARAPRPNHPVEDSGARERPSAIAGAAIAVPDQTVSAEIPGASRPTAPPVPAPTALAPPAISPIEAQTPPTPAEGWEVVVGTNWLNKLGVLTFVIGVAMLVAYSMTHIGALGRVLIGYLLGGVMLTTGVVLERRPLYRNYAYGLVAGGWAAIYFTAFAMHALPSARIVESDLAATAALMAVAGGIVAHSIRYRSQTVTALAYVVAYATLALNPLSAFSLVASVPLAISLLVVAQRFGWSGVSLLGVAATYGLFALRQTGAHTADAQGPLPYGTLAVYWITFETADLLGLRDSARRPRSSNPTASSLFAMNAAGIAGTVLLQSEIRGEPIPLAWIAMGGVAYLADAVVRFRIAPAGQAQAAPGRTFNTMHGSAAMATLLIGWSIHRTLDGSRETLALLLEAEMLVAAGCSLRDRHLRWIGAVLALVVSVQAYATFVSAAPAVRSFVVVSPITALWIVAAAWYVNREAVRRASQSEATYDQAYTWVASLFIGLVIGHESTPAHQGLAGLLFAAVLFEAGLRFGREYRYQACVIAAYSVLATMGVFVFSTVSPSSRDVWIALPASAAVSYVVAWRLSRAVSTAQMSGERVAAASLAWAGTLFLAVFEWRLMPEVLAAPSWAVTATVLLMTALARAADATAHDARASLRLQAYTLLLASVLMAMRLFGPDVDPALTGRAVLPACVVIGLLYLGSLIGRRANRNGGKLSDLEQALRVCVSLAATISLSVLLLRQVRPTAITLAWGVQGGALLAAGFPARERALRLSGLALLLVCILRLFLHDLGHLDALPRILSFVVLGLLLLAVSWTYTRFKEQLRKFL